MGLFDVRSAGSIARLPLSSTWEVGQSVHQHQCSLTAGQIGFLCGSMLCSSFRYYSFCSSGCAPPLHSYLLIPYVKCIFSKDHFLHNFFNFSDKFLTRFLQIVRTIDLA